MLSCLQLNPQHTIPTIIDQDGTVVYDSHAINVYLATKYGKDDSLYPEDVATRAKVNAALHFDSGVLFARLRFYLASCWMNQSYPVNLTHEHFLGTHSVLRIRRSPPGQDRVPVQGVPTAERYPGQRLHSWQQAHPGRSELHCLDLLDPCHFPDRCGQVPATGRLGGATCQVALLQGHQPGGRRRAGCPLSCQAGGESPVGRFHGIVMI